MGARLVISGQRRLAIYNLQVLKFLAISLICDSDYQVLPNAKYLCTYSMVLDINVNHLMMGPRICIYLYKYHIKLSWVYYSVAGTQKKNSSSLEYTIGSTSTLRMVQSPNWHHRRNGITDPATWETTWHLLG